MYEEMYKSSGESDGIGTIARSVGGNKIQMFGNTMQETVSVYSTRVAF